MRTGKLFFLLLFISTSVGVSAQKKNTARDKYNVVFFLVDDLGWRDVAFNGSDFYETPNLDKLASEGVRFTDAYAVCHVCSPTRASILTGKYPARTGVSDWLPGRKNFPFQKYLNIESIQHLPFQEKTIAETLRDNGYKTAIFGKWHLGEDSSNPLNHGFQDRLSEWNKGWPNKSHFSPYGMPGLKDGPKGEYLTDRLTTEALKYIEKNKNEPFFLYVSHYAVHDPIEGKPDLVEKYRKKLAKMKKADGPDFVLEGNPDNPSNPSQEQLATLAQERQYAKYAVLPDQTVKIKQHQDNPIFAAMVESMDESMGRIVNKLKELKLDGKTIIIFVSDNGGMSAANFGTPKRVVNPSRLDEAYSTSNLPLRGAKGWMYEGGIRVPMFIKWPNYNKKGDVSSVPVTSTDFYPTILDMLGLPFQPQQHVDGVSLVPLLKGEKNLNRDAIFWHFPHYSNHGMQSPGGAVRVGDYKLLEYYENNTVQLFNLANDIGEQHDLSESDPAKTEELRKMLHAWRKSVGARMLSPNPKYSPDSTAGPFSVYQRVYVPVDH